MLHREIFGSYEQLTLYFCVCPCDRSPPFLIRLASRFVIGLCRWAIVEHGVAAGSPLPASEPTSTISSEGGVRTVHVSVFIGSTSSEL